MNLRYSTVIVLPMVSVLCMALYAMGSFDQAPYVMGGLAVLQLLIGGIFLRHWVDYGGAINVIDTPEGRTFSLEVNGDPYELTDLTEVLFKVNQPR